MNAKLMTIVLACFFRSVGNVLPRLSSAKWVIVGNPEHNGTVSLAGEDYSCVVAEVALAQGWKTIIINHNRVANHKLDCCK